MPNVTLQQIASSSAADIAALVARAGLDPPTVDVAGIIWDRRTGLEVTVTLAHRDPSGGGVLPVLPDPEPRYTVAPRLTGLQTRIMSILDMQTFRKGDVIAARLHRGNDGNLRTALANLVKIGLLEKGPGGVGYRIAGA